MQDGRILAASHHGAYVIRFVGDVRLTLCTSIDDYFQHMSANNVSEPEDSVATNGYDHESR